ncbi:hypothetical protein JR316_0010632 [Psilocybe cubensis]|uniref:Uncharacterized protein n=1 Tax=Psilocybe cubensis TaxID=181762 RepID=A0ACB8GLZ7_PSICU|nr:hypothetical protein JR316_0010632 [Psilocybe cubensis]KAH9476718.1 hypothetical protein JR316_0010632 [Psilocybe cubensis]
MVNLPYELWLHVSFYLTEEEIWEIRNLNRILRSIAFDRCGFKISVSMQDIYSRKYRHRFSLLRPRAPCVYELEVLSVAPKIAKTASSRENVLSILGKSCRNLVKSDRDAVSNTLLTFTEVRHAVLEFDFFQEISFSKLVRLLQNCLLPSANCLKSLEISYPMDFIAQTLSTTLFFPHLESFTVTLFTHYKAVLAERLRIFNTTAAPALVSFINRHRLTLTTLKMWFLPFRKSTGNFGRSISTNFKLSRLFALLEHIPKLNTLSISIAGSTNVECIFRFFEMHLTTLANLTIVMDRIIPNSTQGFFQFELSFPKLEDYQRSTPECELQKVSSLVSIELRNSMHTEEEFLTIFNPAVSYHKLKDLRISLKILTLDILDIFSLHLPNLHSLELDVEFLRSRFKGYATIDEREENEVSLDPLFFSDKMIDDG